MDDPLFVVRGSYDQRVQLVAVITLLWSVLEFNLSWGKGAHGIAVDWIGAELSYYTVDGIVQGVLVTIAKDKKEKLNSVVKEFLGM